LSRSGRQGAMDLPDLGQEWTGMTPRSIRTIRERVGTVAHSRFERQAAIRYLRALADSMLRMQRGLRMIRQLFVSIALAAVSVGGHAAAENVALEHLTFSSASMPLGDLQQRLARERGEEPRAIKGD